MLSSTRFFPVVQSKRRLIFDGIRSLSTRFNVSKDLTKDVDEPISEIETMKIKKAGLKAPGEEVLKKRPFIKEIFVGRYDTDGLMYPEILEKEEHDTLLQMLDPIQKFFDFKVDSKKIDEDGDIPKSVSDGLKELGLYGQQIPAEYGGLGLNATEYARIQEIIAADGGIGVTLAAHQAIGLKGLLLYGTEEQKKKYLPRLATGEMVAAFALTEPSSGSDAASIQLKARPSPDGKQWILNGSKLWISNGGTADFFTVFAVTADDSVGMASKKRLTAFIVERSFGGITSGKKEDKLGIRGSNTTAVFFENTPVPVENVLGEVGDGFKVAVNILNSGRFSMGAAGSGMMKKLIATVADHALTRKQFGKPLGDYHLIKEKLARMTIDTYVMESMAYFTAGLIDSGQYDDCSVEAAIVKVFSSEVCWKQSSECLQIFGGSGYMKDLPFERVVRDSRILSIFEGTNEILRLFIALSGLQYAGNELKEVVKQLRNPLAFPGLIIKRALTVLRRSNPKLTLQLHEHTHPSLKNTTELFEFCVLRFHHVTELVLQRHGRAVADAQLSLQRLANCAIDIYAMNATLARASRAYCVGLPNSDADIMIADVFIGEAHERVTKMLDELSMTEVQNRDHDILKIGERVLYKKEYFPAHPLDRTFW